MHNLFTGAAFKVQTYTSCRNATSKLHFISILYLVTCNRRNNTLVTDKTKMSSYSSEHTFSRYFYTGIIKLGFLNYIILDYKVFKFDLLRSLFIFIIASCWYAVLDLFIAVIFKFQSRSFGYQMRVNSTKT